MNPFIRNFAIILVVVMLGGAGYFLLKEEPEPVVEEVVVEIPNPQTIGRSVENREIKAHTFGEGSTHLLFVGGMHGGYEWNSVLLAYEFIDYLEENPEIIPTGLSIAIIPSLNPDGLYNVVGKNGRFSLSDVPEEKNTAGLGRFNGNEVDLNRNFDCKWAPESSWRGETVSAGTSAFSEPEAKALKGFVDSYDPKAVIFWHSQANTVYASECENGILPVTLDIMNTYADAAEYKKVEFFDAYPITGDAEGWLASIGIPAITVELKTHETIEFEQNLKGVKALFEYFK